jgi:hypothetical protein
VIEHRHIAALEAAQAKIANWHAKECYECRKGRDGTEICTHSGLCKAQTAVGMQDLEALAVATAAIYRAYQHEAFAALTG